MSSDKPTDVYVQDEAIITKHPMYWFDDGSLILDVDTYRFKIHYTLIARHSTFFSSISTPIEDRTQASETTRNVTESDLMTEVDNHPLTRSQRHVVLEPERQIKPEDIEALLQHLYHDVSLDKDTPFTHLLSLLRVSGPQQLDFPKIYAAARRTFETFFPSNPEAFTHNHPLYDALPVAQTLNFPLVTKAIFYSLVSTTEFDISTVQSDMESKQEGITSQLNPYRDSEEKGSKPASSNNSQPSRTLSPTDSQICLNLMNRLIDHFTPILFTPPATSHMECTDVFAESWMTLVIQPAIENDGVYRPLETLQRTKEINWVQHGMCASCVAEKVQEWSQEQRSIWNLMDEWLALSSKS